MGRGGGWRALGGECVGVVIGGAVGVYGYEARKMGDMGRGVNAFVARAYERRRCDE